MIKKYLEEKEKEWEAVCVRCGGCCGAYDDPCMYLQKIEEDRYHCKIYEDRLGIRKAVSGEEFKCVPVKEIIRTRWRKDHLCTCKKAMKR